MVGRRTLPWLVLLVCAVLGLVTGVTAVALTADDRPASPSRGGRELADAKPTQSHARRVLGSWDLRRSRAFARGDEAALAALYVSGSRTGAADRLVLDGYRSRGLRVTGMTTQVLSAEVLHESARRIEVKVTDVLVDAVATDAHSVRWALPRDQPSTRRVVLVMRGGRWLVDEAYPAD